MLTSIKAIGKERGGSLPGIDVVALLCDGIK